MVAFFWYHINLSDRETGDLKDRAYRLKEVIINLVFDSFLLVFVCSILDSSAATKQHAGPLESPHAACKLILKYGM